MSERITLLTMILLSLIIIINQYNIIDKMNNELRRNNRELDKLFKSLTQRQ